MLWSWHWPQRGVERRVEWMARAAVFGKAECKLRGRIEPAAHGIDVEAVSLRGRVRTPGTDHDASAKGGIGDDGRVLDADYVATGLSEGKQIGRLRCPVGEQVDDF